jgi:hypothetical protein
MKGTIPKLCLGFIIAVTGMRSSLAAGVPALPAFAYQQITLGFVQLNGEPVAKARVYGFCRELNLLWPRRDHELAGRNDIVWDEAYLGDTGANGAATATLPPGKWQFFAAGVTPEGAVVAGWTDARAIQAGETVRIAPAATRRWSFTSANGGILMPRRLFMKPRDFPVWIPVSLERETAAASFQLSPGPIEMWAQADAPPAHAGFALDWGAVSLQTPDGRIAAVPPAGAIECRNVKGPSVLIWTRWGHFGLQGELKLSGDADIFLPPGDFTLGYRRPVTGGLTAGFAGQYEPLQTGRPLMLDFNTPLSAGIDQGISRGDRKLIAQLYLVDGNGHVMSDLLDTSGKPVAFTASVTVNGKPFATSQGKDRREIQRQQLLHDLGVSNEEQEVDDEGSAGSGFLPNYSQTQFEAAIGPGASGTDAVWSFTAPPGILPRTTLSPGPLVTVNSPTFRVNVPAALQPAATNLLAQAEFLAQTMETVSGRQRRHVPTTLRVNPASETASTHDGTSLGIREKIFYADQPPIVHTFAHELAHNFDFYHGGMMESVVEICRCAGGEQISQQPAKWLFFDLMNGVHRKKFGYKNIGLYLYCYAQAGPAFLHFVSVNEPAILRKLSQDKYTVDEATDAICTLGMHRDMTAICNNWGLAVTPEREATAVSDAGSCVAGH